MSDVTEEQRAESHRLTEPHDMRKAGRRVVTDLIVERDDAIAVCNNQLRKMSDELKDRHTVATQYRNSSQSGEKGAAHAAYDELAKRHE